MNKKIGKDNYGFKYLFSITVYITSKYTTHLYKHKPEAY